MNMTLERAIEILDPEHREHYDSIELKKQMEEEKDAGI